MSNVVEGLKYTDQHEWVKLDGDVATVGITDHAQGALGDLVFVELPAAGKQVKLGDSFVVVESVKAASEVYAPLSGEVIAINDALGANPAAINTEPYGAGWICRIRMSDKNELAKLMEPADYKKLVA